MRNRSPVHVSGLVSATPSNGVSVAYTPAITWPGNTIGTVVAQFLHLPGVLFIWGTFVETAGTASATLTIPLPGGFTCAVPSGSMVVGGVGVSNVTTNSLIVAAAGASATSTFIGNVATHTFAMTVPVNG